MQNALTALCCSNSAGLQHSGRCQRRLFRRFSFFFFEIVSFVASAHQTPAVAESTGEPIYSLIGRCYSVITVSLQWRVLQTVPPTTSTTRQEKRLHLLFFHLDTVYLQMEPQESLKSLVFR